ncbi:MAG TPA: glycosyltransferase family 4 protein [Clostridiales bacterium]|nr:glycosyltransferase family 4 protein [Clostridiales bacterium]
MSNYMKIVHIAPNAPYNEGWGYQDNLLPKYHAKLGHDVTLIITTKQHSDGRLVKVPSCDYTSKDGFRVIRRDYKRCLISKYDSLFSKLDVYPLLCSIAPDFIFYHGLISTTIFDVIKYKKHHPNCIIVQDNHLDYNIGYNCANIKEWIIRCFYRNINRKSIPYVSKVYGVTPWRKKYAEDYFKIPSSKTDVLIMGADDEKIDFIHREKIRSDIREKYCISNDDFLIVTGGKIDKKKNVDILMEACNSLEGVKLLIFGQVMDDVKESFETLLQKNKNILFIGWIESDKVYDYFFAADLVFFPGQHSVLWEQACAAKVPCVFRKWDGMEHVNNGGNSDFVSIVTVDSLKSKINELKFTPKYFGMKKVAQSDSTDIYLYSNIVLKSLECAIK